MDLFDLANYSSLGVIKVDFLCDKHIQYFVKSLNLVKLDISHESHRISFLFFLLSGLEILGALETHLSDEFRNEIIDWIYSQQISYDKNLEASNPPINPSSTEIPESWPRLNKSNAFAGFRATGLTDDTFQFDCGFISMTYCALASLCILKDDLKRVDRASIVDGLKFLQNKDGSFKPSILGGESDLRIVYCAVAVSYILNDFSGIDVKKCTEYIMNCLTHEGAFGQLPKAEAHGGVTYCALASLSLMSQLDNMITSQIKSQISHWCMRRFAGGFSGRPNKDPDTCYSFWIGATLQILGTFNLIDQNAFVEFILMSQYLKGGISKNIETYPDPLHTFLSLAGLSFVDDSTSNKYGIKISKICPALNVSQKTKNHLSRINNMNQY